MSRLDFEFEQVLGSWLDHCAESLSLQQQPTQHAEFLEAARATVERFRSMAVDNLEKVREIYRVILTRLKRLKVSTGSSSNNGEFGSNNNDSLAITPPGMEHTLFELASGDNGSPTAAAAVQTIRQAQFIWLVFDCFLQTLPVVVVPWCATSRDFATLVETHLPWEFLCDWCFELIQGWMSVLRSTTAAVDRSFSDRVASIARQRRTSVVVSQNMASERAAKKREDDASAATRTASAKEMLELQELAQRLVAALQKHKPSDGRTVNVKLEASLIKQEAAAQLQQAAASLRAVGNTAEDAYDVDNEYEPTYVAGAQMGVLAQTAVKTDDADDGQQQQQSRGGRKEPRKRPPR